MATWNSRGLRGSSLEELINYTNEYYREKKLAVVQKIPTPIKPIRMDKDSSQITLAYFEKDSTVDYIGVVQGIPICFDAKECAVDTFSLQNIHEHQYHFMKEYEEQQGVSFLIIFFTHRNKYYYLRFSELKTYMDRVNEGHAKNFKYEELNPDFFIHAKNGALVHYLELLDNLTVKGDLYVDCHHTIEDTGIVLGKAIKGALGDKKSIKRFGNFFLPMDETLVMCAIDLSGRPYLVYDLNLTTERVGYFDTQMVKEFFYAVSYGAEMNLNLKQFSGSNDHHIIEAAFKAFAKALDEATSIDDRLNGKVLSTKGSL